MNELQVYCRESANTFNQFEVEYEKNFQTNLKKENTNIERELVKMFKTPFTPTKYKSQDDYYTYINYQWILNQSNKIFFHLLIF